MLIGYARVSTIDQNHDLQIDALQAARCEKIWTETACGADDDRPELAGCLAALVAGDTLVVWKLDRLARSTIRLCEIVRDLQLRGINFKSLTQPIDTTTPAGKLVFTVFAAIAEFERDMIRERVTAGLRAAMARGQYIGRPKKLEGLRIILDIGDTMASVARELGVSKQTIARKFDDQYLAAVGYKRPRRKRKKPRPKPVIAAEKAGLDARREYRNNLYRLDENGKRILRPRIAADPGSARHHQGGSGAPDGLLADARRQPGAGPPPGDAGIDQHAGPRAAVEPASPRQTA